VLESICAYFAKDAAQNQGIAGPITVTLDCIPPPDPEPPVITSPTATGCTSRDK
jgi:hypothetical protein